MEQNEVFESDLNELSTQTQLFLAQVLVILRELVKDETDQNATFKAAIETGSLSMTYFGGVLGRLIPKAMRKVLVNQDRILDDFENNSSKYSVIAEEIYKAVVGE